MLPTTVNGVGHRRSRQQAVSLLPTYLRRIIKPKQLDLEYRHTSYHKQTKNQWARDDPAFVIICSLLVAAAATAYCVTFGHGFWRSVLSVLSAVVLDFLLIGFGIATLGWLYAFDVHCNAYFPLFILLYVAQFLLSPLLLWRSFVATLLSNALYGAAFSYYHYITFLGYSSLPFLSDTVLFLYPIGAIAVAVPFCILLGFNPTRFTLSIYF